MAYSLTDSEIQGYRWVVMGLWMFANVSAFMVMSTIGLLLPAISADMSLSPGEQGLLGSAAFWGNITLAIPLSWLMSRYSPKRLTSITLAIGTLCLFFQGWSSGFWALLIGRLAFGISVIARQPARAILTQQWFPTREFVMVNSASNALFGLVVGSGQIATPFLFLVLGDNWRGVLQIFGVFFGLLTAGWMLLGRERPHTLRRTTELTEPGNVLKGALKHRDLWIGGIGFVGATTVWSGFLNFFPTMMLNTYGVDLSWSGAILAVGIFVGGMSGVGFGFLAMRAGHEKSMLVGLGLLMGFTYLGMTMTSSLPLLFALSLLNGLAWGFWPILFTVPFHLPGILPRELAVAVSFTMMMTSLGTALGPLVIGFLQQALGDLQTSLFISAFGCFILSVAALTLRFSTNPYQRPQPSRVN